MGGRVKAVEKPISCNIKLTEIDIAYNDLHMISGYNQRNYIVVQSKYLIIYHHQPLSPHLTHFIFIVTI